jgi:cytosine/adenosine deaminase-related metal-dependent hydrolase
MFEEARAIELHARLDTLERGVHSPGELLTAATRTGMESLGWDGGEIKKKMLADFVAIDMESMRTSGGSNPTATAVFAATAADVTDVIVGGRHVVKDRIHTSVSDVPTALSDAIASVT